MSSETDTTLPASECQQSQEDEEITFVVVQEENHGDHGEKTFQELNEVVVIQEQVVLQGTANTSNEYKESENMHELSTLMKDVYSLTEDKFGQELIHFIEPAGHPMAHWQQHDCYPCTETFSPGTSLDESSMSQSCEEDCSQTSSCDTSVTLAVLNATNPEDNNPAVPLAINQLTSHHSLTDHNYYAYPNEKDDLQEYSVTECLSMGNPAIQLSQENDVEMDQEKVQRMKRRKEKNRECSRQFRLKQKDKEQRLTQGKMEKSKTLDSMKRNVQKFKAILSKISQQCSCCPKTAMLLGQCAMECDKENVNPNIAQDYFK